MVDTGINVRVAERVRTLRADRGLSLEALATSSSVSRSMISLIERGESSASAVVLDKLAGSLGVHLSALFDAPPSEGSGPVARRSDQPVWSDPASGYVRRNVSPPSTSQPVRIVEVALPPGARVGFDNELSGVRVHQQVWVLEGAIEVTVGAHVHSLAVGDCASMELDAPTMFVNPTGEPARYAVVVASERKSGR
jgi:transcriptional regulator with XRE-family HTH domain